MLIIETGILMELIWGCNYYIRMPVYLSFKIYDCFHQITVMKQYFKFKFKFDTNNEVNNGEKIKDNHLLHVPGLFPYPLKTSENLRFSERDKWHKELNYQLQRHEKNMTHQNEWYFFICYLATRRST